MFFCGLLELFDREEEAKTFFRNVGIYHCNFHVVKHET